MFPQWGGKNKQAVPRLSFLLPPQTALKILWMPSEDLKIPGTAIYNLKKNRMERSKVTVEHCRQSRKELSTEEEGTC